MRNISAARNDMGLDWIDGYKPMAHYPRRPQELVKVPAG
jgi:hypothetical protein